MKGGVQLYLICPRVVLTKWSAWHSQQISRICLCCELLGKVRKRTTFLSSFPKKYYPPLTRIHFRNLSFFAAGFGSWCNLQWSRKVSDQPDMCSLGALEPWQHDRRKNLLQCGNDVECGTLKTTMQQISKLVRRQDGIKTRECQIPSDYYVDSFKKEKRHILFPPQLLQYRKINIVVCSEDENLFASNKNN